MGTAGGRALVEGALRMGDFNRSAGGTWAGLVVEVVSRPYGRYSALLASGCLVDGYTWDSHVGSTVPPSDPDDDDDSDL